MSLGDISGYMKDAGSKVPDLDWLKLDVENKDNIPVPMNVEIVPQLVEAWSHDRNDNSTQLISNQQSTSAPLQGKKASEEDVRKVVDAAKVEIMRGALGKDLTEKLSSQFPREAIVAAKEELKKVAAEQGLLGNVYVDLSPFDSCADASRMLGHNKIRMARYVVGMPKRHICSSHMSGVCKELKKKVVSSVDYDESVLNEYTTHLKIAGIISADERVASKEGLRNAIIASKMPAPKKQEPKKKQANSQSAINVSELEESFSKHLEKEATEIRKSYESDRFEEVRPVIAFVQNEMLKGKIGDSLKESIQKNFAPDIIQKYSSEMRKVASLQGLMGNVYVDVAYYQSAEDAVHAIKRASTNPAYLINTRPENEFDNKLEVVSKATGCQILPRDGSIDKKVAHSYIEDLTFSDRISSNKSQELKQRVEAGENVLAIIRNAFLATQEHKKAVKEGGVQGYFASMNTSKYRDTEKIKTAAHKSMEAGIGYDRVSSKMAELMPTTEAESAARTVLGSMKEVKADVLNKCVTEKYPLAKDASIVRTNKCANCILSTESSCLKQDRKFAGTSDIDKPVVNIDPKTSKVLFEENPDVKRADINSEFEMYGNFGSGMNIALSEMREQKKEAGLDIDGTGYNMNGLDAALND